MSDVKLLILIVEDHADTAYGLKMYFSGKGHEVDIAMDVKSALAAAAEKSFDLLLSDLALPDGNGWDLLRQLSVDRPLRAIAISGYDSDEDLARSKAAGFLTHLSKPVAVPDLDRAFAEVMQAQPSGPQ